MPAVQLVESDSADKWDAGVCCICRVGGNWGCCWGVAGNSEGFSAESWTYSAASKGIEARVLDFFRSSLSFCIPTTHSSSAWNWHSIFTSSLETASVSTSIHLIKAGLLSLCDDPPVSVRTGLTVSSSKVFGPRRSIHNPSNHHQHYYQMASDRICTGPCTNWTSESNSFCSLSFHWCSHGRKWWADSLRPENAASQRIWRGQSHVQRENSCKST